MRKFIFLWGLFWNCFLYLKSQNFSIENATLLSDNPYKVKIDLAGNKKIQKENIQLIYNEKNVDFELKPADSNTAQNSAYCILVETTGFTHIEPIKNFKNAIAQFLTLLNPDDKVALCAFSEASTDKGSSLKVLSNEFLEDKTALNGLIYKLATRVDTNAKADIYKSIHETLDWMSQQNDLPEKKYLIVLTAGINHSYSSVKREDCENKSQKLKIPIYTVVYKTWTAYSGDDFQLLADNTQGRHKFVDKSQTITDFLSAAFNLEVEKSVLSYKYEMTFLPEKVQSGINRFELKILEENLQGEFMIEKNMDTTLETILFIGAGIGVLLIGIGLLLKGKKTEKNTLNSTPSTSSNSSIVHPHPLEKISEAKPNLSNTVVNIPSNVGIQKTAIASSNVPTLKIVSIDGVQHHRIEKLPITIGRDFSNDIVIADNSVSKKHAQLYFDQGYFILEDLDSTNGLMAHGQKMAKIQLKENEKVYLGNATLELYLA